jgi:NADH-quinone oxidoreductase subunit C
MPDTAIDVRALITATLPDALTPAVDLPARANEAFIAAKHLPGVAGMLREAHGFGLLTNITVVDFLAQGVFEVVYHFVNPHGGPAIAIKVRVERDRPRIPSLSQEWPGANLQEREAFDLYGVEFEGHPNLRRVYMWDELEGFPMRKDFPKHGDKYMAEE